MVSELRELFVRDLQKLIAELEAYPDDASVWRVRGDIVNPAGTLALHLIGNLSQFVGADLGGLPLTEYVLATSAGWTAIFDDAYWNQLTSDASTASFALHNDPSDSYAIGVILIVAFLLLLVVFRSLVIALFSIVMNLVTVGAAFGFATIVFQHGIGAGIIGIDERIAVSARGGVAGIEPAFVIGAGAGDGLAPGVGGMRRAQATRNRL